MKILIVEDVKINMEILTPHVKKNTAHQPSEEDVRLI